MTSIIEHKKLAKSRLAVQFKQSTKLIAYIESLLYEADSLEELFRDLIEKRWIDTAEGANLDVVGSIVGQRRELIDAEIFDYFGFADNPQAQSFGSVSDASLGGRFIKIGDAITGFRSLNDDEYRKFIRARIIKNITRSTPEEIISQLKFIFDAPLVLLIEGDASYQISLGMQLTLNEKSILKDTDIIPKTAGVRVNYFAEFDIENFFSFKGVPGGLGFGSLDDPNVGGKFAKLIL